MNKNKGLVFNIQKYSVHDGPGIRSIVFFKGCPLACKWCSNPEGMAVQPEISYKKNKSDVSVLVNDIKKCRKKYNDFVIDKITLEELMVLMIKGGK